MTIDRTLDRLFAAWRAQHLAVGEPNAPEQLALFEKRHRVTFPDDFRRYLLRCNGMTPGYPGDVDRNGFSFLPLESNRLSHFGRNAMEYAFCDYLQSSWVYAISLAPSRPHDVTIVCPDVRVIAASFGEFLELYLADDARLYPANGTRD